MVFNHGCHLYIYLFCIYNSGIPIERNQDMNVIQINLQTLQQEVDRYAFLELIIFKS